MYSTALPLTFPSLTDEHRLQLLEDATLMSLFDIFATIPDPRSSHGLRYELPYLLTCLVAAMLCNCNSTVAAAQWCREQRPLLARLFAPRRFLCPCDSLYRWLLPRLSAEHLEWALADWVRATLVATDDDPSALSWQDRAWGQCRWAYRSTSALLLYSAEPGDLAARRRV